MSMGNIKLSHPLILEIDVIEFLLFLIQETIVLGFLKMQILSQGHTPLVFPLHKYNRTSHMYLQSVNKSRPRKRAFLDIANEADACGWPRVMT